MKSQTHESRLQLTEMGSQRVNYYVVKCTVISLNSAFNGLVAILNDHIAFVKINVKNIFYLKPTD